MGALTDIRKRSLVDHHRLPSPLSDEATPPPFKKPKLFPSPPPPSPPSQKPTPPASPATSMPPRRYPPPAPFRRPVHAPQLNIRVLGLGSSASTRSPRNLDSHGSPFSQFRFAGEERPAGPDANRSLGLEEYKRLVVDVQEEHAQLAEAESPEAEVEAMPASELTVVSRDPGEESDLYILDRKVDDGGMVVMESTPVREQPAWTRRSTPLYKELYENLSREHDSKLSSIEFEAKLLEKKRWSLRSVREALWLSAKPKLKEDPRGPFTPLTDEEEDAVNHALRAGSSNEVLVVHKASNIEITREVMRCLSDRAWLNDEVINVYLELLKERETREPKRFLKCHFFNSFFYKKLISGKNGYDFKAIRRWTTQKKLGYSLIECDKIFVPIHKEVHWCLAVINVKDKILQYLDSLGGMDKTVLRVLAKYFMDEVKDKSERQIDTSSWRHEAVEDLPLQQNGWDCGMFMLKYTDFYGRGLGLGFGQEHMKYFRKRTIKEILSLRAE